MASISSASSSRPNHHTPTFTYDVFLSFRAEKRSVWTEENVKQWKGALTDVANLGGMELSSSRSETSFIAELVETVQCKLDLKQLSTPAFSNFSANSSTT
ncbi:hypothetical protein QVD17_27622 [Tagetes erecta]|uniref:TIR domain-containing protein n=1 Tax=Tagetes erecta TaxID=13708 RepID=A0AAD8K903_TARER|nr:hypothetical protein QVD17_27622 [Tagetes erecta]